MPFVERDGDGKIVGLYNMPQVGRADSEMLPETDEEVVTFRNRKLVPDPNAPLTTEELYDMLLAKGVVSDADRPRARKP